MNPKTFWTVLFALLLSISFVAGICAVKSTSAALVAPYSAVKILFPCNETYDSRSLTLNVTFSYGGLKYTLKYDIDGKYEGAIPWTVYNPNNELHVVYEAIGSVKLPELSDGSHCLTVTFICDVHMSNGNPPSGPFKPISPGSLDYEAIWTDTVYFTIYSNESYNPQSQSAPDSTSPETPLENKTGAAESQNFPFKDITAGIQNISPKDNGSYTGNVLLDIKIRFDVRTQAPDSRLIPYQDICCIYRLDGGEWRNASLYSATEQEGWCGSSLGNVYNDIYCNYSALLQGLSNGAHLLDISVKPDLQYHYRISSEGKHVQHNLSDNASITFYVFGNYDELAPTDQSLSLSPAPKPEAQTEQEPFPTTLAAIGSGGILTAVAACVIVYFMKRKAAKVK